MSEKLERQLPTGIGGEDLQKGRETLPAVEVANEVIWVNDKMNLPFDLKIGEQSRLGMFLTPNPQEGEKTYDLEVSSSHTRSGILGRVIFSDKEGRLYRDVDLKGVGFNLDKKVKPVEPSTQYTGYRESNFSPFTGTTGMSNNELIQRDIKFSEKFLKAGIRVHRVVALFELKEIIDEKGQKINVDEAKKRGMLQKDDEPVIEMRAFGVRSRLFDIIEALSFTSYDSNRARKLLSDAQNVVAQELNIDSNSFSTEDYFKWLIKATAINVARMHYNKWVSGYLTAHNITLDGRIVDLDSVETEEDGKKREDNPKSFEGDSYEALESLRGILFALQNEGILHKYLQFSLLESYNAELSTELARLKKEKVKRVRS